LSNPDFLILEVLSSGYQDFSRHYPASSVVGPSRHIAVPREFGRYRGIAEVDMQPSIAEDNARDPSATSAAIHRP
jgi:hypothetical protein